MVLICGVPEIYKIRWGFSFYHKPDVYGVWSQDTIKVSEVDKKWASTAYVEIYNVRTRRQKKLYEVPYGKFERFEWRAAGSLDLMKVGPGDTPIQSRIIGCRLVADDFTYSVMISGKTETTRRWSNG